MDNSNTVPLKWNPRITCFYHQLLSAEYQCSGRPKFSINITVHKPRLSSLENPVAHLNHAWCGTWIFHMSSFCISWENLLLSAFRKWFQKTQSYYSQCWRKSGDSKHRLRHQGSAKTQSPVHWGTLNIFCLYFLSDFESKEGIYLLAKYVWSCRRLKMAVSSS